MSATLVPTERNPNVDEQWFRDRSGRGILESIRGGAGLPPRTSRLGAWVR